jgi:hypothetical protein
MEESSGSDLCGCNIPSSDTIDWHRTPNNKNIPRINEGPHLRQ